MTQVFPLKEQMPVILRVIQRVRDTAGNAEVAIFKSPKGPCQCIGLWETKPTDIAEYIRILPNDAGRTFPQYFCDIADSQSC